MRHEIEKDDNLIIVKSSIKDLKLNSEISDNKNILFTIEENGNSEQLFLTSFEIEQIIEHLELANEKLSSFSNAE